MLCSKQKESSVCVLYSGSHRPRMFYQDFPDHQALSPMLSLQNTFKSTICQSHTAIAIGNSWWHRGQTSTAWFFHDWNSESLSVYFQHCIKIVQLSKATLHQQLIGLQMRNDTNWQVLPTEQTAPLFPSYCYRAVSFNMTQIYFLTTDIS